MTFATLHEMVGDRYRVEDILAVCGQACVSKATDLTTGEAVVLRQQLSSPGDPGHEEESARFAEVAAVRIVHPNVIETVDAFQVKGRWVHVQKYVEGRDLRQIVTARGRLPSGEVVAIARQIASGLEAIHSAGLIHRDLKPANIMIGDDGRAIVIDLGISKRVCGSGLTRTGAYVGTVGYSAPEQVTDSSTCDSRADIFSLGVVLYECLTGGRPFTAVTPEDYLREVTTKVPLPARLRVPEVPRELSDLCTTALSVQRVDRPASAKEFGHMLARCGGASVPGVTARCLACGGRVTAERACSGCGRSFTAGRLTVLTGPARGQVFYAPWGVYELGREQLNPGDRSISRRLWRVDTDCLETWLTVIPAQPQLPLFLRGGELLHVGQSIAQFTFEFKP
ncbi:MAG: serine/threonine protein kinase [Phycisphaerales bacterium]|nr:serine/threonine protein kinase [Phycisphaerales bacterium]